MFSCLLTITDTNPARMFTPRYRYLLPALLMSSFSTSVMIAFGSIMVRMFGMAPFTFPFQAVTWMWMLGAQSTFHRFPLQFSQDEIVTIADAVGDSFVATGEIYTFVQLVKGVFNGISQVFLVENAVSGAIMLCGIFVSSVIAFLAALYGSALGVFFR